MTYAIIGICSFLGSRMEICRVETNPEDLARAARLMTTKIGKRRRKTYSKVEVVEIQAK